ncbi:hypothetical protein [Halorarius litoreus]|uniref:hypothetical protein n=1 Tax=Halorarius litoreus TaxID=2962676 RepID=UPI0020CC41E4|nr:hypothetical protein [Halorarius litoreus]
MVDEDFGTATIVYEDPYDGTVERTVENEHIAYFQDHWILKVDESDGHDVVRRIPYERVHYVERSVDEFREEVGTLTNQVESFADDLRETLFGGPEQRDDGPTRIDVDDGSERQ